MIVSKNRLVKGITDYIANEVIPHVPDTGLRIALATLTGAFRTNPVAIDRIFSNPVISMLLIPNEQGAYDVEHVLNAIREAISKNGQLTITIPPIPLISKGEKTLAFSAQDADKLSQYIERSDDL